MASISKSHERSEPGLDVLRAVAVLMMFAVHVRRIQLPTSRSGVGSAEAALDFFMDVEPFITSLFLFVAGYSVVLAFAARSSPALWWRKALRRGAQLYALSIGLFVLQYGIGLPDLLLSSGILQVIALSMLVVGVCLCRSAPEPWLVGVSVLGLLITFALEAWGKSVSGVNAGPGGSVPLVSHAAFGAIIARGVLRDRRGTLWRLTLLTAIVSGLALWVDGDFTTTHASQYRDLKGESFVTAVVSGRWQTAPLSAVHFWNHSTRGAVALFGPMVAFLGFFLMVPKRFFLGRSTLALRLVGRHALFVYVLHLCALGMLDALGLVPESGLASWAFVLALFAVGTLLSAALERFPGRPNATA